MYVIIYNMRYMYISWIIHKLSPSRFNKQTNKLTIKQTNKQASNQSKSSHYSHTNQSINQTDSQSIKQSRVHMLLLLLNFTRYNMYYLDKFVYHMFSFFLFCLSTTVYSFTFNYTHNNY